VFFMRRLAVASVSVLFFTVSTVLFLPVGGSEAQPAVRAPTGMPPSLMLLPLELLSLPAQPAGDDGHRMRHRESAPDLCFREGPGSSCVRVCSQYVASLQRCDRFPSAHDGCLRFVKASRPRCLRGPDLTRSSRRSPSILRMD